jgi:hypothetical protein
MRNWDGESAPLSRPLTKLTSMPDTSPTRVKQSTMAENQQESLAPSTTVATTQELSLKEKERELSTSSEITVSPALPFDKLATKRLLRKQDRNLIPFLALIYLYAIRSSTTHIC